MKSLILLVSLVFASTSTFAQKINVGGTTISAGGLQLIGTISTSTSKEDDDWDTVGIILIVIGTLVEGGDLTLNDDSTGFLDKEKIWEDVVEEALATNIDPAVTQEAAISYAVKNYVSSNGSKEYNAKAQEFSQLIIDANEQSEKGLSRLEIQDALTSVYGNGGKNSKIIENVSFLAAHI